jgi:hypothetical protein
MYGGASWALSPERASASMKMGKNLGQNTRGHRYITVSDKINLWDVSSCTDIDMVCLPLSITVTVQKEGEDCAELTI